MMDNLIDDLPDARGAEVMTPILSRPGVRIERIVSHGQTTPAETPYDQDHDEWVMLVTGAAKLWIDGVDEQAMQPGDHVLIPAHARHRVLWTAENEPTVWLAVHFE